MVEVAVVTRLLTFDRRLVPPKVHHPELFEDVLAPRVVQLGIQRSMEAWLGPELDRLGRAVWENIVSDLSSGKLLFPEIRQGWEEVKAISWDDDNFWEAVSDSWEEPTAEWMQPSMDVVLGYEQNFYKFYVDMQLWNERVSSYTQNVYVPDQIRLGGNQSIVSSTRTLVKLQLVRWQAGDLPGGRGLQDLRNALTPLFGVGRAELIAVTEATRVYAEGSRMSWMDAWKDPELSQPRGIVVMNWHTAADERVCPICGPLNGTQMPLHMDFPVEGGVPPAHPRCRCSITPGVRANPSKFPPPVPSGPGGELRGARKPSADDWAGVRRAD